MFLLGMSVILEINRDFPYQVALSFDEIAMEVLAWLEDRSFEWDMYVDLPAGAVRYCFRSPEDASAFKRRFMHASQRRAVGGGD
jgi:hypothetical protein